MSEHRKALALSTAAWTELHAKTISRQAAVLRGAKPDELEAMRAEAHALLDAKLDLDAEAAEAVRALLPE